MSDPNNDMKLSQLFNKTPEEASSTSNPDGKKSEMNKGQLYAALGVGLLAIGFIVWAKMKSDKPPVAPVEAADSWTDSAAAVANGINQDQLQQNNPSYQRDSSLSSLERMNQLSEIQAQLQQQSTDPDAPAAKGNPSSKNPNTAKSPGAGSSSSQPVSNGPSLPSSIIPAELRIRLDPQYDQWIQQQAAPAVAWQRAEGNDRGATVNASAAIPGVDPGLQRLYAEGEVTPAQPTYLPAGAEITAVTDMPINTDYPSAIRATIVSPQELKGGRLIVTYSGPMLERVQATANTMVLPRGGKWVQYSIQGVIMTDLPLLNGRVNNHIARRMVPLVVNAGLAGGAVYLAGNGSSSSSGISTKDQIWANMAQSGIAGTQAEITRYNAGKPEQTVTVPAGQEFRVMLTQGLEVK